ncbi:MAG: hypothetical protein E7168_00555 [Firmicutes bacterium]|nr:hypothetical protein [Bacillota bacterium]
MKEEMYNYYVAVKTTIYDLYPALKKLAEEDLEKVFEHLERDGDKHFGSSRAGTFASGIAKNTYLFPYDNDLYLDLDSVRQDEILDSGLQEKYGISDQLLIDKFREYRFFEFQKTLLNSDSSKKFQYETDAKNFK